MFYQSSDNQFYLYQGDTIQVMCQLDQQVDMIFADPPYFLSNGGKKIQGTRWYPLTKDHGINLTRWSR